MGDQQVMQRQDPGAASIVDSGPSISGVYGKLTSRELEVAQVVAEGMSNRDIASCLCISQKTVEYHLSNVFGKLGVNSRTQLALALTRVPPSRRHWLTLPTLQIRGSGNPADRVRERVE